MKKNLVGIAFFVVVILFALTSGLYAGGGGESSSSTVAAAEPVEKKEVRISKQFGLPYLAFVVLEGHKLIEKNAREAGLGDIGVEWLQLSGGAAANDALLSGSVDLIGLGTAPAAILWDKTGGAAKLFATLDRSPIILNTNNPNVKSVKDFTANDKIAVPSVKVSIQAVVLQIAASKAFGIKEFDKIDPFTVALPHPDAIIALTSGRGELTAHFGNEPFITLEQQDPKIHQVLSSYDIFGGPHTTNVIATSEKFYSGNPKLVSVIIKSLNEANEWIAGHKREAAQLYLTIQKSKEPLELIEKIINKPEITYSTKPLNITIWTDFLYEIGSIKSKPTERDLFFPKVFE